MTQRGPHASISGVRENLSIRRCAGVLSLTLSLLFSSATLRAEDTAPDWFQQDAGWKSRSLSLGEIFQLRLDGRSFAVRRNGPNPALSSNVTPPSGDEKNAPPRIIFNFEGAPVAVKREMLLDKSRQAIRILDVFSNSDASERRVRVDYFTNLGERGGVHYNGVLMPDGTAREYGQGVSEDAPGAIVLAERDGSDAVPLFLWGQKDAKWHGRVRDIGSSLNLSYEGTIPAGGKLALLHWVATAGLERGVRLEQGFEKFYKAGHLVQPLVPADIVPLVANFQPDAFRAVEATPAASTTAHHLVLLDEICEKLKLKREANDILVLGPDQQLAGEATLGKVTISTRGQSVTVAVADVAALAGGAGIGRLHHLFLRNGEVLAGQVTLVGAGLETPTGRMSLSAEAVDLLLLRAQPQDGQWPANIAGYVQTQQGELFWLSQPPPPLKLAASFGSVRLPIWQVERRREPAVSLSALLEDGSRINGAAAENVPPFATSGHGSLQFAIGELTRWGNADAVEKVAPDGDAAKAFADHHCTLRDGSTIAGALADETLRLHTSAGETKVSAANVAHLESKGGEETTVELTNGVKLKGVLLDNVVHWRRQDQTLAIPSTLLTELVTKGELPAPPAANAGAPASP